MEANQTFTIIKPDAVTNGHIGAILNKITAAGFRIKALKMTQFTTGDAEAFYAVHNERPFFGELVSFMTSGPIVAAVLEKENAVNDFRTLIGATNPQRLLKALSESFTQLLWVKMLFMVQTAMKTQLSKLPFTFRGGSSLAQN
mgnify:CR=1 FL=1